MNFEWSEAAPEAQGFLPDRLATLRDALAARGTQGFFVTRGDAIVCEWYAPGRSAATPHYTASLAKALVGGTSLLLALGDGHLGVDDLVARYVPQWRDDPVRSRITIRHLATHTSGLEDADQEGVRHEDLPGWMGAFWRREPDPFTIARDQTPVVFPPGTRYAYSNPGMAMLAYCVTAALAQAGAPETDLLALLRERVMEPLGVPASEWSIGYRTAYLVEGLTLYANWGGGSFTARAVARVGRLMRRAGDWQGRQLLAAGWVRQALTYAGTPKPPRRQNDPVPASGLCWYTNEDGVWPEVPRDAFAGAGAGHQVLLVVPSLDLIAVRQGANLAPPQEATFWGALHRSLFMPLIQVLG